MSFIKLKSWIHKNDWLVLAVMTALFITSYPPLTQAQAPSPPSVTNPSLKDTDGDGYLDGPDQWIDYDEAGLKLRVGEDKDGDGKYKPEGKDGIIGTDDDETDPNNPHSYPDVTTIMANDSDKDGLSDFLENIIGTYHDDADSDNDGINDKDEVWGFVENDGAINKHLPITSHWARRPTNPLNPDSDGDGLPDGLEMGMTQTGIDPDTQLPYTDPGRNAYNTDWYNDISNVNDDWIIGQTASADMLKYYPEKYTPNDQYVKKFTFLPVANSEIVNITDPLCIDTDHDGLKDYEEDKNQDGTFDAIDNETDPSRGMVNIPPPIGWNSHRHYLNLGMGFWRSLTDEGHVFLGLTGISQGNTDFSVYGQFILNFGHDTSALNITASQGNAQYTHSGNVLHSDTNGANWLEVGLFMEGSPTASMFQFDVSDTNGPTLLKGDAQGAFSLNLVGDLIPENACYVHELDDFVSWLEFLIAVGKFIGEEKIENLILAGVAVVFGGAVAAFVSVGLIVIAGTLITSEIVSSGILNSVTVGPHYMNAIIQNGWPIGISLPHGIGPFSGGLASAWGPIRPHLYRSLHNLDIQSNTSVNYPKPTEYFVHTVNNLNYIIVAPTGELPLKKITFVYSENFFTRTFKLAEAASGVFQNRKITKSIYLSTTSGCADIDFEDDEEEMPPGSALKSYYIPPHTALGASGIPLMGLSDISLLSLSTNANMEGAGNIDKPHPILDPTNSHIKDALGDFRGTNGYDLDVLGINGPHSEYIEDKTGNSVPTGEETGENFEENDKKGNPGDGRPMQGTFRYKCSVIFGFIHGGTPTGGLDKNDILVYRSDDWLPEYRPNATDLANVESRRGWLKEVFDNHPATNNLVDAMYEYGNKVVDANLSPRGRRNAVSKVMERFSMEDVNSKLTNSPDWAEVKSDYTKGFHITGVTIEDELGIHTKDPNDDNFHQPEHGKTWVEENMSDYKIMTGDEMDPEGEFANKIYYYKIKGNKVTWHRFKRRGSIAR